jgi:hypothetical protein
VALSDYGTTSLGDWTASMPLELYCKQRAPSIEWAHSKEAQIPCDIMDRFSSTYVRTSKHLHPHLYHVDGHTCACRWLFSALTPDSGGFCALRKVRKPHRGSRTASLVRRWQSRGSIEMESFQTMKSLVLRDG